MSDLSITNHEITMLSTCLHVINFLIAYLFLCNVGYVYALCDFKKKQHPIVQIDEQTELKLTNVPIKRIINK